MSRIPRWCRWLLGSLGVLTVAGIGWLVPAVQQARYAAMKSNDK